MNCPTCGLRLVQSTGPADSKILLIGGGPGFDEVRSGYVFTGPTGDVLNRELYRVDLPRDTVRVTNLWQHDPNADEFDAHRTRMMAELRGKQAAFFMGAELAELFLERGVTDVSGVLVLSERSTKRASLKSKLLPPGLRVAVFAPNPAIALQRSNMAVIGEFRDALQYFVSLLKREGLICDG